MIVSLSEVKSYLRVDYAEEDTLLQTIIDAAEALVLDISRADSLGDIQAKPTARMAALYAVAYLYEHREEADHRELTLTLRAMLGGLREDAF